MRNKTRCISFDSYIKPQLQNHIYLFSAGCISFDSYIKPQLCTYARFFFSVVYLLIPTSNHNLTDVADVIKELYIF